MALAALSAPKGRISYLQAALGAVALITALRYLALGASGLDLYGDEAQYWAWSQSLAFGYFTKPPLVAWIIRAATAACGDGEACVRAASPLLHGATALVLYALARRLYDSRIAFWTAVAYATLPAVSLSSLLISTDVPLLFFWSAALLFLLRTIESREAKMAAAAGIAIGLGLLAKYAMAYFVPCAVVFCLMEPKARWFLSSRQAGLCLAVAAAIVAPNLYWNFAHGWATFAHTAANADWSGSLFHPAEALAFLGSQFGVFGPILFAALLWRTLAWRPGAPFAHSFLVAFSAPVLLIVLTQSLLSRAHANWAAPAFCAATVLTVAWLASERRFGWLKASVGLHLGAAALLYGLVVMPAAAANLPAGLDPLARLRGWDRLAAELSARLDSRPGAALLADDRMVMAELLYYLRGRPVDIRMWDESGAARNQFEMTIGASRSDAARFLLVTKAREAGPIARRFQSARFAEELAIPISAHRARRFYLFDLEGLRPRDDPGADTSR
jgi:4-amino-4-deoxy-L-arabinose transferase-like glycosyltransferase